MDAARSYWPIGYDDLESYHDKFAGVCGARGKTSKLQGKKSVGGKTFEAPLSIEFPNPPLTPSHNMVSFEKAARDLGYQSFFVPAPLFPPVPPSILTALFQLVYERGRAGSLDRRFNSGNPEFAKLGCVVGGGMKQQAGQ